MATKLKPGLTGQHFAHPLDLAGMRRLMDRLAKSELIKNRIEKLQSDAEEEFYLLNLADNTKLTEVQGGSVYRIVQQVADIFCIQVPNVFLDTKPEINAYALGGANSSIVLTSALVDNFSELALRAAIAHEIGHIICKHTFYRIMAENFGLFSGLVNLIPFLSSIFTFGFRWYLFDWYRKSELSADRAALLGTQNLEAVQNCILNLAGGSTKLSNELSIPGYLEQAMEFQEIMKSKREKNLKERIGFLFSGFMLQHVLSTHPWPAVRLKEISSWASSKHYDLLVSGDYESALISSAPSQIDDEITTPAPIGEDIKEYVKDIGKATGDMLKGFFKRPENKEEKPDKE